MQILYNLLVFGILACFFSTTPAASSAVPAPAPKESYTYNSSPEKKSYTSPSHPKVPACTESSETHDTLAYEFEIDVVPLLGALIDFDFPVRKRNPLRIDQNYWVDCKATIDRLVITFADDIRSLFQLHLNSLIDINYQYTALFPPSLAVGWAPDGLTTLVNGYDPFDIDAPFASGLTVTAVRDCSVDSKGALKLKVVSDDYGEFFFCLVLFLISIPPPSLIPQRFITNNISSSPPPSLPFPSFFQSFNSRTCARTVLYVYVYI